ncbi:fatty acid desaturase [Sulfoacidibacillus thermotolerans]|uniref:Fatty acid desaturase n=1 Tax=Sulfoacidibacillus thermotolerans TaxID=1765684 RepID=A0A2U3D625_SULT2|nr:fatty acid desaturase [Sulfoacidibacillus thermotolerans]PWI56719.1 fatty acid desaturase [Sulfoacidibacillus thermotolerans]
MQKNQSNLKTDLAPYQHSDIRKSLWQLTNTILPFFALWILAYLSLSVSIWLALALTIPAAGFLVRLFIIFHDCCHHSFFKSRRANEMIGIFVGFLAFFPYHQWKFEHSVHHATNSNLNRRGRGDIWTLTVDEYMALPLYRRMAYRLYRNPLIMFGLGPLFILLIQYRFNRKGAGKKERFNTHATNIALLAIIILMSWGLGWQKFLLIEGPILYLSGMAGIWLFYIQHQFEDSYFEKEENWNYVHAALHGSSFYKLPKILQWMTGNIGFHHIHHLGPRVPNYHLQRLYENNPILQKVPTISLLSSLRSLRYRVWDEESKKFVSFRGMIRLRSGVKT